MKNAGYECESPTFLIKFLVDFIFRTHVNRIKCLIWAYQRGFILNIARMYLRALFFRGLQISREYISRFLNFIRENRNPVTPMSSHKQLLQTAYDPIMDPLGLVKQ